MAGNFRARSMLRSSVWRSAMRHLLTEQAVVGAQAVDAGQILPQPLRVDVDVADDAAERSA
jgi:hypothetical protein